MRPKLTQRSPWSSCRQSRVQLQCRMQDKPRHRTVSMTCLAQQSEQSAFSGGIPMARGHSPLTMEGCGDSEPNTRTLSMFTTNNYQSTPHSTTRAGALMLPSSCLDGSVTPVGPGLNPQYTGAPKAGGGCGLLTRTQNEPTNTTTTNKKS